MGLICYALVTGIGAFVVGTGGFGASLLPALGFATSGPVAGTIAANAQSYVGNVAADSIFSGLQAIAMAPSTP